MDQLRVCVSQCKDELQILSSEREAYSGMVSKARADISARYEALRAALDQNYRGLTEELDKLERDGTGAIDTRREQMDKHMREMESFLGEHGVGGAELGKEEATNASLLIKWQENQNRHQLKHVLLTFSPSQRFDDPKSVISIGDILCNEIDTSARVYLLRPQVHHILPIGGCVAGIVVCNNQIFISMLNRQYIEVFDATSFKSLRQMKISELYSPEDLSISTVEKSLFISEPSYKNIHRVAMDGKPEKKWAVNGQWSRVSVSQSNTLLLAVTFPDYPSRIYEYSTIGKFLRSVTLDASIERPMHVIQISDLHFVICHRGRQSTGQHGVCVVDAGGKVVQSYGETKGSGSRRLHSPTGMAVDKYDHVFVCDSKNNRIVIMDPTLNFLGEVNPIGEALNRPVTVFYDEMNRKLYVGEDSGQRLVVIKPSQ